MALILIADDDRISRLVLAAVARRGGHDVEATGSVAETVERMGRTPCPDCIMLDINMPDGTAWDVLSNTEGLPVSAVPVILMSASDLDLLHTLGSGPRIRARLTKPIPASAVTAAIQSVLA